MKTLHPQFQTASLQWRFDDATFKRSVAALD
jgi:hypothetical protein